jgi:hypothetical protein
MTTLAIHATYYRTGLLLGVLRGEEVHRWAERVIAQETEPPFQILELVLVSPTDLSGLRDALWPLAVEPEPLAVLQAILARLHGDLDRGARSLGDTLTILRQLRSMLRLPAELYAALNATLVDHAGIGAAASPIPGWLRQFAGAELEPSSA